MRTGQVDSEDDTLYYEVRGHGPPLLLIHGGIIDAGSFARAADLLAADYTAISYDRRGYSRSSRRDPQNFEVGQQARDAVAILRAEGHDSALIVGSSGGAIIGLEMAKRHPAAVTALVAHEPPTMRILPNAEQVQEAFARIYLSAWTDGTREAVRRFSELNAVPRTEEDVAAVSADDLERARGNMEFFVREEMLPFSNYIPDVEAVRRNGVRVVLGVGELSRQQSHGQTAPILAARLDCPLIVFPGHHTSFLGMAEEWVATLREALQAATT